LIVFTVKFYCVTYLKSVIRRFHQCVCIWSFTSKLHDAYRSY